MAGAVGVVETAQGQRTVFRDCALTLRRGYDRGVQGLGKIQKLGGDGSVPCAAASPDQGRLAPASSWAASLIRAGSGCCLPGPSGSGSSI